MVDFDADTAIRRCAAIEDELDSLGANDLMKERDHLKKTIKSHLTNLVDIVGIDHFPDDKTGYYDEVSNWEAELVVRTKDEWDIEKLRGELTNKQKTRYITLRADQSAIKEGISNGDLSRAKLESVGAVTKTPYSFALYVRERKIEDAPV